MYRPACTLFMSPMHNNRNVALVTSGAYYNGSFMAAGLMDVSGKSRVTEILDFTVPGATWEESKHFFLI